MITCSRRSVAFGCIILVSAAASSAKAADWPSEVTARYDISFAGFNVGSFDFRSKVNGRRYDLSGEARVSAVFGAFKWRGSTRSQGQAVARGPAPKTYAFDYRSNSKTGSVRLGFMRGHIVQNDVVPYKPFSA